MDVYVYTCKECLHFNTENCPWEGTKEDSIAGECFAHNVPTTAWDGTSTECWSAIGKPRVTATSSGAPIAISDNSGKPVNVIFNTKPKQI